MSAKELQGSCVCGDTRFSIALAVHQAPADPDSALVPSLLVTAFCHCTMCQRLNGAPFVWTTHWRREAVRWRRGPPDSASDPSPNGASTATEYEDVDPPKVFPASIDTFESIPGRKWKLRCKRCGCPIGSWNEAKQKWTIWPTLLERHPQDDPDASRRGQVKAKEMLAPRAHHFYDTATVRIRGDGLTKWAGYEGESARLDDEGRPL